MKRFLQLLVFTWILVVSAQASFSQGIDTEQPFGVRNEKFTVKLFPNPATEYLNVEIKNGLPGETHFTLYNIIGNPVKLELEKIDDKEYRINVKDIPPGYYLLALKDEEGKFNQTYKFLKR
jgi:hypothetical protein